MDRWEQCVEHTLSRTQPPAILHCTGGESVWEKLLRRSQKRRSSGLSWICVMRVEVERELLLMAEFEGKGSAQR